jgi:hypothetical protein
VAITDLGKIPAGFTELGGEDSAPDLAGMIVWSTDPVNSGLYLWDGEDWQALAGCITPCSGAAPAPTAINIPAGPFANGETFDVSCTATEDGTTFFIWTAPSGLSITGGQGTKTIVVSGTEGTYDKNDFTVFAVNQCGLSGTVNGGAGTITVKAALTTTAPPISNIAIPSGSTTELDGGTVSGGNCAGYSYQWQVFNDPNWENIPDATNALFTTPALTTDTRYIRITTCGNETVTSGEINVTIQQLTEPDDVTATSSTITCGNSTTLSYTGGTGDTFVWYSGSCGGTEVGMGNDLSVSPINNTTYYGRWEHGGSVSDCKSVTVTVNKIATSVAISGPSIVYTNTNASYTASNLESTPDVTYSWFAVGGEPESGTGINFTTRWNTAGLKIVEVYMTSAYGCYMASSAEFQTTARLPLYRSLQCNSNKKADCTCEGGHAIRWFDSLTDSEKSDHLVQSVSGMPGIWGTPISGSSGSARRRHWFDATWRQGDNITASFLCDPNEM